MIRQNCNEHDNNAFFKLIFPRQRIELPSELQNPLKATELAVCTIVHTFYSYLYRNPSPSFTGVRHYF